MCVKHIKSSLATLLKAALTKAPDKPVTVYISIYPERQDVEATVDEVINHVKDGGLE